MGEGAAERWLVWTGHQTERVLTVLVGGMLQAANVPPALGGALEDFGGVVCFGS